MAKTLDPAAVENLQMIEVVVTGPDQANRLFMITGSVLVDLLAGLTTNERSARSLLSSMKESFTLLLGPTLTRRQFHRSIAAAFPLAIETAVTGVIDTTSSALWSLEATHADWNDEAQKVQLRFEASVETSNRGGISFMRVGFQVTILAQTGDA